MSRLGLGRIMREQERKARQRAREVIEQEGMTCGLCGEHFGPSPEELKRLEAHLRLHRLQRGDA